MEPLEQLLVVQEHDTALDQLAHKRANHPLRAELASLDGEAAALRASREGVAAEQGRLTVQEEAIETDLRSLEERVKAIEGRMYGGSVSASRELQAMAAEVDTLLARRSDLETAALELLEQRDPVDAAVAAFDAQLAANDQAAQQTLARLAEVEAELDADAVAVQGERDLAAAGLPADLLARYDQLRARLGGIGAARLVSGSCSGCHLKLPATELDRIKKAPPGDVHLCDQCSRILVP